MYIHFTCVRVYAEIQPQLLEVRARIFKLYFYVYQNNYFFYWKILISKYTIIVIFPAD